MIAADEIARRACEVRDRIDRAARAAGRDPATVRLLAVTKTHPMAVIRTAYAAGLREFGENYVQELVQKADACGELVGISWHAIGHVQTNKARDVARVAAFVHTVDNVRLAEHLGRKSADVRTSLGVFVQVNVGAEAQKSGCTPEALGDVLDAIDRESSLRLCGLMTVPPYTDDPQGARRFFEALRSLRDAHGGVARLPELSMGMTHDLEVAIACGATIVRVGTAIFGERPAAPGA